MLGGGHRLDGAVRLAAVGRAEQGDPASRQPARRIELVVMDEARVVFQQHGEGHAFLVLAARGANCLAHASGFERDEFGETLVAELLQVEAVGEFEHAFEAGLQIGPVLALPGLDFGSAEQVVLVGGNAPLQFKLERAMVQRYQIAQVVADLVDRGDRVLQELVESRQLRPDPREAALAVLFVHLGEGPLEQLQTTAHVLLDGRLEIAWKVVALRAVGQAQCPFRFQQVGGRTQGERLLAAVHIDVAGDLAEVAADDPLEQFIRRGLGHQLVHCRAVQPQPERFCRPAEPRHRVADIGANHFSWWCFFATKSG